MPNNSGTWVYRPNEPRANANGFVEKSQAAPLIVSNSAPMVMGDIAPYKSVAADVNGRKTIIGGRRQHREFLQRNGYTEVGNESMKTQRHELSQAERVSDIKRAMGER